MEHDTIVFIEKNHQVIIATLIAFTAWFRKEICLVVPAIWRFVPANGGFTGIVSSLWSGNKQVKESNTNETQVH